MYCVYINFVLNLNMFIAPFISFVIGLVLIYLWTLSGSA